MLALTLLITNPLSKIYFLEKCGLPLIDGKVKLWPDKDLVDEVQVHDKELQAL
jgi:hypothetical protein